MVKAPFNLAHPATAMTLARYFAKREVKRHWRARGLTAARALRRTSQSAINSTIHGLSAGSLREVLEGLNPEARTATATLRYPPVAPSPGVFLVRKAMRSI